MRRSAATVLLYCLIVSQSKASQNDLQKNSKYNLSSSSEFIFESYPNQELIPIRLLGAIKNAGLYHIPADMKLSTLLALAGGTTTDADLENIVVGNDQQRAPTSNNNDEKKSLTINLEESLKNGAATDYTLVPNDIVLVKNKSPMISNDSFRAISIVSVVLTSVLTGLLIRDRASR